MRDEVKVNAHELKLTLLYRTFTALFTALFKTRGVCLHAFRNSGSARVEVTGKPGGYRARAQARPAAERRSPGSAASWVELAPAPPSRDTSVTVGGSRSPCPQGWFGCLRANALNANGVLIERCLVATGPHPC